MSHLQRLAATVYVAAGVRAKNISATAASVADVEVAAASTAVVAIFAVVTTTPEHSACTTKIHGSY